MTNVPNPAILIRQPKRLPWLKWLASTVKHRPGTQ